MGRFILTITLNPAIDYVYKKENTRAILSGTKSAGGKGLNVARTLKALNVLSISSGFLGGSSGRELRAFMHQEKLKHDFVPIAQDNRRNITIPVKRYLRVFGVSPQVSKSEWMVFKQKYAALLPGASLVVLSGSLADGLPKAAYAQLVRSARQKGVVSALDASGAAFKEGVKARPWLISPNIDEAGEYLGCRIRGLKMLKGAAKNFHRLGINIVLISLGRQGALASNGSETWSARPPAIKVKNNVGCGDALLAGFIKAHRAEADFQRCLKTAVACGTANALNAVPGKIEIIQVQSLMKKIILKKV